MSSAGPPRSAVSILLYNIIDIIMIMFYKHYVLFLVNLSFWRTPWDLKNGCVACIHSRDDRLFIFNMVISVPIIHNDFTKNVENGFFTLI